MIVTLPQEKHIELNLRALFSIECRLCHAYPQFKCDVFAGELDDLYLTDAGDYLPVHRVRMDDATPIYEMYVIAAKEEIRQDAIRKAQAKFAGSTKTHSDFYKPAGPEIKVVCNYCNAEAGNECRTVFGIYTKSHRPRQLMYRATYRIVPEERFVCPTCKAGVGRKCVTASGAQATVYHASRRKLANV